jgi:hypothetical protein
MNQAAVSNVEQKRSLVIDGRPANKCDGWAGSGANPWHLDDETDSIVFLTNASDQEVSIGFEVSASGVHYYLTKLRLAPQETRAVDLRALRDAQAPDFDHHLIPAHATDGSVNWIRLDDVPVTGRVVMIQRHGGVASNYDCCTCPCPASYVSCDVSPPPPSCLGPHVTMQCTCIATYQNCNNVDTYSDVTTGATWTTDNANVASFDTTTKGLLRAHAAGSTTMRASFTGTAYRPNCQPPPCHLPCLTNPVQGAYSCLIDVTDSNCPDHTQILSDTDVGQICQPSHILNAYRLAHTECV